MDRIDERMLEHRDDDRVYYAGHPFTGVAYRQEGDGRLMYEVSYREGRRSGLSREWYSDGQLSSEEYFVWDWAHGPSRRWHGNGRFAVEEVNEWGVCLRRRAWDEQGNLVEDHRLEEGTPEFRLLRSRRTKFGHVDLGLLPSLQSSPDKNE